MTDIQDKLKGFSDRIGEHIIAVRGTLELIEASVDEEDLHSLTSKAIHRMEELQKLSDELCAAFGQVLIQLQDAKKRE
jgi:hypothetical protein